MKKLLNCQNHSQSQIQVWYDFHSRTILDYNPIPSFTNCEGDDMVGIVNHSNQLTFTRTFVNKDECPRVAIYINIRMFSFHFLLCRDIIDYRDILLVSFFNNNDICWLMNIYSDSSSHSTLKYLKNTKVNIWNLLIMTGDFNIRDSLWDSSFPHHSSISNEIFLLLLTLLT